MSEFVSLQPNKPIATVLSKKAVIDDAVFGDLPSERTPSFSQLKGLLTVNVEVSEPSEFKQEVQRIQERYPILAQKIDHFKGFMTTPDYLSWNEEHKLCYTFLLDELKKANKENLIKEYTLLLAKMYLEAQKKYKEALIEKCEKLKAENEILRAMKECKGKKYQKPKKRY